MFDSTASEPGREPISHIRAVPAVYIAPPLDPQRLPPETVLRLDARLPSDSRHRRRHCLYWLVSIPRRLKPYERFSRIRLTDLIVPMGTSEVSLSARRESERELQRRGVRKGSQEFFAAIVMSNRQLVTPNSFGFSGRRWSSCWFEASVSRRTRSKESRVKGFAIRGALKSRRVLS